MSENASLEKYVGFLFENTKLFPEDTQNFLYSLHSSTQEIENRRKRLKLLSKAFKALKKTEKQLHEAISDEELFAQTIQQPLEILYEKLSEIKDKNEKEIEPRVLNLATDVKTFTANHNHIVLTHIFVPRLADALCYRQMENIICDNEREIQFDGLYVRKKFLRRLQDHRLEKKEILAVECKNKVDRKDIIKYAKNCEVLKANFQKEAEIWKYTLRFESWFVACFGWDDQMKALAKEKSIRSIDSSEIEVMLREHELYDPNIPVCPS